MSKESKHLGLKDRYEQEIRPTMKKELGVKSGMAVPKITKVVINMGTGDRLKNKDVKEKLMKDIALITGQAPKVQAARISVAGFGIREGNPVGLTVTLRRGRMYDFLERLISVVLPRLRDFRGVPLKGLDSHGNYTLGFRDYSVFPEIDIAKLDNTQGFELTIVTNTKDKDQSKQLLTLVGMPFEKEDA